VTYALGNNRLQIKKAGSHEQINSWPDDDLSILNTKRGCLKRPRQPLLKKGKV
jgi:hypothetical protein